MDFQVCFLFAAGSLGVKVEGGIHLLVSCVLSASSEPGPGAGVGDALRRETGSLARGAFRPREQVDTKHRLLHSDKCCEGNVQAAMKEQNRSIVGWGQRPSEKVTVAMALRAEQRERIPYRGSRRCRPRGGWGELVLGKLKADQCRRSPVCRACDSRLAGVVASALGGR